MPSNTIAFDIEVAGFPWEEVDEITRGYLLSREGEKERREAVQERTGLYPGLGKVIAIGMWLVGEDRGLILLEGKSEETRDWIHVDDAASLMVATSAIQEPYAIVNGASGERVTVADVLGQLREALGVTVAVRFNGVVKPGDPRYYHADVSRARALGWLPSVNLRAGLDNYVDWLRQGSK